MSVHMMAAVHSNVGADGMALPVVILHCPFLGRDLRQLLSVLTNAQILSGKKVEPGEHGCLVMHQAAISLAMDRGWERVLVVEDDCLLAKGVSFEVLQHIASAGFRRGYDTIIGGSVRAEGARVEYCDPDLPVLLHVDRACSAHFVIHHERGYDAVLKCGQPYDLQLGDQGAKMLLTWPFVATQRPGLSGIGMPRDAGDSQRFMGPQPVNYEGLFKAHEIALGDSLGLSLSQVLL